MKIFNILFFTPLQHGSKKLFVCIKNTGRECIWPLPQAAPMFGIRTYNCPVFPVIDNKWARRACGITCITFRGKIHSWLRISSVHFFTLLSTVTVKEWNSSLCSEIPETKRVAVCHRSCYSFDRPNVFKCSKYGCWYFGQGMKEFIFVINPPAPIICKCNFFLNYNDDYDDNNNNNNNNTCYFKISPTRLKIRERNWSFWNKIQGT